MSTPATGTADSGGWGELDRVGSAYLEALTDTDLALLVGADSVPTPQAGARIAALRREPALVLDVLDRPATSAAILALTDRRDPARFAFLSPFLLFAAAVHRTAADLASTSYALERAAPRVRVPVFDGPQLSAFVAPPRRRLALVELLTSYARVSSGVAVTRTSSGVRRRRWNDLDPARLAVLLEASPESERPGVWRRLGDLALFLCGVFPDAAWRIAGGRVDAARLARLTGVRELPDLDRSADELLEWLGVRWYRLAARRPVEAVPLLGANGRSAAAAVVAADFGEHFRHARRVLNAVTDRYLFPVTNDWFGAA